MTTAIFETAALASAISKAATIAPATGQAFDKAAGIVIEVDTENDIAVIKATDTEVYYMEWISPHETRGPSSVWRLPSKILANVINSLPIGSGKQVTFTQSDNTLMLTSGRTKGKFQLIDREYYPEWEAFDPEGMVTIPAFGAQLKRVMWAASTSNDPPFTGVYMDGSIMAATDKYRVGVVPCKFEASHPISVPPMAISAVLKDQGDVRMRVDGTQLFLMPDDHTQIRATICGLEYPNISRITRREYPETVRVSRDALVDSINRSKHVIGSDRSPLLKMWLGKGEITVAVIQETEGLIDTVEVPGFCDHARLEIGFSHSNITQALLAAPSDLVEIGYDPSNPKANVYVSGDCGYEAWIATRRNTGASQ